MHDYELIFQVQPRYYLKLLLFRSYILRHYNQVEYLTYQ